MRVHLHRKNVAPFLEHCRNLGMIIRDGAHHPDSFQLVQIQPVGSKEWFAVYDNSHDPEHVTVDRRLIHVVRSFQESRRFLKEEVKRMVRDI